MTSRIACGVALFCFATGCAKVKKSGTNRAEKAITLEQQSFTELQGSIANPSRGLFVVVDMNDKGSIEWGKKFGRTLVSIRVVLENYRDEQIPQDFLDRLNQGFENLREAGVKAIVRFQYNKGEGGDAELSRILTHIEQVAPVIRRHSDIIAFLQAGFIGAWGEWHSSSNNLDNDDARKTVLMALLEQTPTSMMIQIRSPIFKESLYPGGPMNQDIAFSGSNRARIGHHNDCLLSSDNDRGTYPEPINLWRNYVETEGRYTPVGGETCAVSQFTECGRTLDELKSLRWSYLNGGWPDDVIKNWRAEGCFEQISEKIGYRFVLRGASWPRSLSVGDDMPVTVDIENIGFAPLYDKRPIYIVLIGENHRYEFAIDHADPRLWTPGSTTQVAQQISLDKVKPGKYRLALWLPDINISLRARPEYAIRMANHDTWSPTEGINILTGELQIADKNL